LVVNPVRKIIDAHIHFDQYKEVERDRIISAPGVAGLISVSTDLPSAKETLALAKRYEEVFPAIGYHPEQELPLGGELDQLRELLDREKDNIVAIGEVGLPYYLRRENPSLDLDPYLCLLELFMKDAARLDKPLVLHAVYEDAALVCDLLERHSVERAHFHWFKGEEKTIRRMINNGYYISITPDILYKERTRALVKEYPLSLMMVETDGPWPFEGPFAGRRTEPQMLDKVIEEIARVKGLAAEVVNDRIFHNTVQFYSLDQAWF